MDKVLLRGKNILEISDLVRGALLFKNKFDIKDWVDDFKRKYSQYIDKYEFKEKGSDKVFDYHGSHHIDLKINGLTVELQVMSAKLWKYKEPAHDIYTRWRSSPISPPEVEKNMARAFFRMGNESVESKSDKLSRIVELMVERELRRT